jgi:hypothetical protein
MNGLSRPHAAMNAMLRLASRVKGPPPAVTASLAVALFAPLLVLLKRRLISDVDRRHPHASWATICAFADDQIGEAETGRGPSRTVAVETRYRRYTEWCASRGHSGVDLVIATALWKEVGRRNGKAVRVALEPNIVPYHTEAGIEHWVMWYDPALVPGSTDLDPSAFATHVRAFLDVGDAECCCFQNVPERRSVPQVAHAHVFLRARRPETAAALAQLRAERRLRSPWAEAERLGGRGEEVGF